MYLHLQQQCFFMIVHLLLVFPQSQGLQHPQAKLYLTLLQDWALLLMLQEWALLLMLQEWDPLRLNLREGALLLKGRKLPL